MTDHELEDFLKKAPYVDDGGFTSRVTARLPAPRRLTREHVILAATALGCLAVCLLPPARTSLIHFVATLGSDPRYVLIATGALVAPFALRLRSILS